MASILSVIGNPVITQPTCFPWDCHNGHGYPSITTGHRSHTQTRRRSNFCYDLTMRADLKDFPLTFFLHSNINKSRNHKNNHQTKYEEKTSWPVIKQIEDEIF